MTAFASVAELFPAGVPCPSDCTCRGQLHPHEEHVMTIHAAAGATGSRCAARFTAADGARHGCWLAEDHSGLHVDVEGRIATYCECGYRLEAHERGRCPSESEARAAWGDR